MVGWSFPCGVGVSPVLSARWPWNTDRLSAVSSSDVVAWWAGWPVLRPTREARIPIAQIIPEVMSTVGRGPKRAALIYQHATSDHDREIAAALGARIQREAGEKWPVRGPEAGHQSGEGTDELEKPASD